MNENDTWTYYVAYTIGEQKFGHQRATAKEVQTGFPIRTIEDVKYVQAVLEGALNEIDGIDEESPFRCSITILSWNLLSAPMSAYDPREDEAKAAAMRQLADHLEGIPSFQLPGTSA